MDSKNIFIACSVMLRKAEWEKIKGENEWSYVGDGAEFKAEDVQNNINEFFSEDELYLVTDRHRSKEIKKELASSMVKPSLEQQYVTLCNKEFKRFIVFNYIGVAKQGEYHS
jgi:hypothetical protein